MQAVRLPMSSPAAKWGLISSHPHPRVHSSVAISGPFPALVGAVGGRPSSRRGFAPPGVERIRGAVEAADSGGATAFGAASRSFLAEPSRTLPGHQVALQAGLA